MQTNRCKHLGLIVVALAMGCFGTSCNNDEGVPYSVPSITGGSDKPQEGTPETGTPENPGGTPGTSSSGCDVNEKLCDGICKDILSSKHDCGGCGHACEATESCQDGKCIGCDGTLCGSECVDLTSDPNHCGTCDNACRNNMVCTDSVCECDISWLDCDGDPTNGCEAALGCSCIIGQKGASYSGSDETRNVGECKDAVLECQLIDGLHTFEPVEPEVLPSEGTACDGKDYNCNGKDDGHEDMDHDGFSICDGDCCDNAAMCNATDKHLINPGMMEVPGNNLDDNCNGEVDETPIDPKTVAPIPFTYGSTDLDTSARALARAMGIIWECDPAKTCPYGLVKARLTRSESTKGVDPRQVNVMDSWRDKSKIARVLPREGNNFAVLSSGAAQDVANGVAEADLELEKYASETKLPNGEMQRTAPDSKIPSVYANAHGNKLETHKSCPTGTAVPAIFDSVQLHLEIKAPVNAMGIQFDFRFFSREYPQYLCSSFNDFFLAILTTEHADVKAIPDRNIAFDMNGNPVSVNNGFFTTCNKVNCANGSNKCPAFMSCASDGYCSAGADTCRDGASAIDAYTPNPFVFDMKTGRGGGTAWLSTTAPIVGGETITLDFYIWDTQDNKYDSTVLIDNFKWLLDSTKVNTGFAEDPTEIN
ncbi:MAG: choice-of-anchor L domain-containing protein [Proteobacteria bacterium]|nr:choice-of-anchor L domain-containing protein [Pseudomonadota bacterium]